MKSFQNFKNNIVEAERKSFGSPSGYDPQGEPMYKKRPGPKEPGRRAQVQASPKTPTQVKGEIEAAKGFSGVRSGGLETRTVPTSVTQTRQARAQRLLGPDVWDQPKGAGQKSFERGMRKVAPLTGPSKGHQERALRDFINQSSKELGTSTDEIIASMIRGKSAVPFTSARPAAPDPWKPSETATVPEKPKTPEPAAPTSSQKPSTPPKTEFGGTPKSVSFSTKTPSKTSGAPKTSTVDIKATEVPGTKFAEPSAKPKKLPGLNLGTEPAGKMVSVRAGQSQTIRPTSRPGVTGTLEKPKAGGIAGAKIEPVKVKDITSKASKLTGNVDTSKVTTNYTSSARSTEGLGQEVRSIMRQQRKAADKLASQKFAAGGKLLGRGLGAAGAAYDIYTGYKDEKAKGSGTTRALLRGLTQAAGTAVGAAAGGAVLPVVGTIAGATAGSAAAGKLFDVAAGENARERAMRALQRRQSQPGEYFVGKDATKITQKGKAGFVSTGTGADRKTSQLASTKVIKDPISGKENVGYLAFKTSPQGQKQAVYKTGDSPQDLAKTSSNWMERIGRTYAPSLYTKSDAANQRRQLSNARAQQNLMQTKLGMG